MEKFNYLTSVLEDAAQEAISGLSLTVAKINTWKQCWVLDPSRRVKM